MATEQTKRCPKCGYEYESWVDVCPDCGAPLETRPKLELIKGELNPDVNPRWTVVTNVPNAIIGSFIKGQIEDAGIPVLMFRSRSADIAEFSHNDFVPQDLLVPLHRFRDARKLIDAPPDTGFGDPRLWDASEDEEEEAEAVSDAAISDNAGHGEGVLASSEGSDLPEGWARLPTEADLRALQDVRRTQGDALKGWYWSDEQSPNAQRRLQPNTEYEEGSPYYSPVEEPQYPELLRPRSSNPYGTQGYASDWSKPSKWIRIFYAILLLVMSLPFILQLLGDMWSMLGRLR